MIIQADANPRPGSRRFVVGSFTTAERRSRGIGLTVFEEVVTGQWQEVGRLEGIENPSYLVVGPDGRHLYAVHADRAYASTFLLDRETPSLRSLGRVETGGINGVHLALDHGGRWLVVANYASGSVVVLPVREDGILGDCVQVVALPGPAGPYRGEQDMSHPHQVVFDPTGRFVLVPDKGLDRIFVLGFDPVRGRLLLNHSRTLPLRPGSGPRHVAFQPKGGVVWILNELASTIVTCRWNADEGSLSPCQWLPTLPSDFVGQSKAAAIVVSAAGNRVFTSNRGHDSVSTFAVDPETGLLIALGWMPTQGACPRFMDIDPRESRLLVANEEGHSIVSFELNGSGTPLSTGRRVAAVASPAAIAFASNTETD